MTEPKATMFQAIIISQRDMKLYPSPIYSSSEAREEWVELMKDLIAEEGGGYIDVFLVSQAELCDSCLGKHIKPISPIMN